MTLNEDNPSLQVTANKTLEFKQNPVSKPKEGEVLLHVKATGICGSDLHFWHLGQIGELKVLGNCVLGHEAAGEVLEVGEGVTNVKVGDRVAIEPGIPCNKCFLCQQGDYNLCDDVKFIGVYPYQGSIQRYLVHDAKYVHRLPETMSFAEGALVEPLSVAYHGIERAGLELGRGVLIAGAGPIGLLALLLSNAKGSTPIVITDIAQHKLDFAKKLVPSVKTYLIESKLTPQQNASEIRKLFGDSEYQCPPVSLECTGLERSIITLAYVTRRSGTLMVIGVGKDIINNFPFMHLSLAEIDVKFINRYHDSWPPVIKLISEGVIDVNSFVTHRFALEDALEAMNTADDRSINTIKVLIED